MWHCDCFKGDFSCSNAGSGSTTEEFGTATERDILNVQVDSIIVGFHNYVRQFTNVCDYLDLPDMLMDVLLYVSVHYPEELTQQHFDILAERFNKTSGWAQIQFQLYKGIYDKKHQKKRN